MQTYICPMHSEIKQDHPGKCPKCGMDLVLESELSKDVKKESDNYMPLIVVVGLILLTTIVINYPDFLLRNFIETFMIGFFLVFSGFKLIDLKGFAEGYGTYDLLAKKWNGYGFIYPFIELFFALTMILNFQESAILIAEIIVMTFSGIGVLFKILKREPFRCACLGTVLKVPLTYITLIEDFGMAGLALILLLIK